MSHALIRTSPYGQDFFGKCIKCDQEDLPWDAIHEPCPKDRQITDERAISILVGGRRDA